MGPAVLFLLLRLSLWPLREEWEREEVLLALVLVLVRLERGIGAKCIGKGEGSLEWQQEYPIMQPRACFYHGNTHKGLT